jgi:hypothetical protein
VEALRKWRGGLYHPGAFAAEAQRCVRLLVSHDTEVQVTVLICFFIGSRSNAKCIVVIEKDGKQPQQKSIEWVV